MENNTLPVDRIICGDNTEVLAGWEDECIDMFLTSPPYDNLRTYNGFEWDFDLLADQLWRVMKPGAVGVWVVGDATINGSETGTSFRQALGFMERGFRLHDTMIYQRHALPMNHNRYEQHFEYMFVFSKGRPSTFNALTEKTIHGGEVQRLATRSATKKEKFSRHSNGNEGTWLTKDEKVRGNVWYIPSGYLVGSSDSYIHTHPATFPDALAKNHILSWSNPGDIVLDCFVGSGTTAKMAALTDRRFIGIDISPEYCQLAERRVSAVQQQPRLFAWDMSPATPEARP